MATDQKLNIKLVKEIENYPYIYNYTLPEYARRDVTEKAWVEIGEKVHLSGPECKEKWKNLRSVFARRLKRRRAGKAEKKPYYLAKYMQFTIPFLKMNSRVSRKLLPHQVREMSDSEAEVKILNDTDEDDEELSLPKPSTHTQYILTSELSPHSSDQNSQMEYVHTVDPPEISLAETSKQERIEANKGIKNNVNFKSIKKENQPERKSNRMFLLSLLADMDAMDDKQRRYFKQRMLEVVDDIFNTQKPED